jgi:hypothetical protein
LRIIGNINLRECQHHIAGALELATDQAMLHVLSLLSLAIS